MNNLNNQDPNRHIPAAAETGSVDKFAKQFRSRHGTFSDAEGENILYSREQKHVLISDTPMLLIEINSISNVGCQK